MSMRSLVGLAWGLDQDHFERSVDVKEGRGDVFVVWCPARNPMDLIPNSGKMSLTTWSVPP